MDHRIISWFSFYALALTLAVSGNTAETPTPYTHHLIAADTGGVPTAATAEETARLYLQEISKQPNNRALVKERINSFNEMREAGQIKNPEISYLFLSRAYSQLLGLPLSSFHNYPEFFKFVDVNEIWKTADNPDYTYGWTKAGPSAVPVLKPKDQKYPTRADPHWTKIRADGKVDESGHFGEGWSFEPKGFEFSEEPPEKPIKLDPIDEPTSFAWDPIDTKEYYWPSVSDGTGGIVDANCSDYYEENGTHYERLGCHATQPAELMGLVVADKKRAKPEIEGLPPCPLADHCPADFEGFEKIKTLETKEEMESAETAANWQPYPFEELGFEVEFPFEPDWKISDESESNVIDLVRSIGSDDDSPLFADVIVSSFGGGEVELPSENEFHSMLENLASAQVINEGDSFEASQLSYQGDDNAIKTVLKDADNKRTTSVYFVANNRIYALRIVVDESADPQENTDRFLNSFKLIPLAEGNTNTPPTELEEEGTPPVIPAFVPYTSIAEFELLGRGIGADSPKEDDDRCQKGFDPITGEHDSGCRAPTDDDFVNWPYLKDVKNVDKPTEELKTP
jgi:hypothetical protein